MCFGRIGVRRVARKVNRHSLTKAAAVFAMLSAFYLISIQQLNN